MVVAQTNAMASLAARRTSHMLKAVVRRPSSNEEIDEIAEEKPPTRPSPWPAWPLNK